MSSSAVLWIQKHHPYRSRRFCKNAEPGLGSETSAKLGRLMIEQEMCFCKDDESAFTPAAPSSLCQGVREKEGT